MDRSLFKNLMETEEYNESKDLLGEVMDRTKNIYSEITDNDIVKELLGIILLDLRSIKTCTKMIREKMKDQVHANDQYHYDENLGLRFKIISIEELSELMEVLTEDTLTGSDYYSLLEEFADASISMNYIKELMGIDEEEIKKAIYIKNKRILNKLNKKITQ